MTAFSILVLIIFRINIIKSTEFKNVLYFLCDDSGKEMGVYGNKNVQMPNLDYLANHSVVFNYAYTSVSSCSPSRSTLLTGLPIHQNGMFGLAGGINHFNSFQLNNGIPYSLSKILMNNSYYTGIIGKYHISPQTIYPFNYSKTEADGFNLNQVGRNITLIKQYVIDFFDNQRPANQPFFLEIAFHDTHRG
eukprot:141273_1